MEFQHFEQFLCYRLTFESVFFLHKVNNDIIELKGHLTTSDHWAGTYIFISRDKYISSDGNMVYYHESLFHFKDIYKLINLNNVDIDELKNWFNKIKI